MFTLITIIAIVVTLLIGFLFYKGRRNGNLYTNIATLIQTVGTVWAIWFATLTIENNNLLYNTLPELDTTNFKYENRIISFNIINKGSIDALIENISVSFDNSNSCIKNIFINDKKSITTPYENSKMQIYGNEKDKYLYDIYQEHSQTIFIELQFEPSCFIEARKYEINFKFQFTYKTINQKSGYYVFNKTVRVL